MANKDDYLTYYREFFENFAQTVNPNDQLPVKLASYKLINLEVIGGVIDWTTQYLTQKKCPQSLIAPLIQIVIDETRKSCKKQPTACGFNPSDNAYEPLKLMQTVMAKTNEVCLRYLDNSMLCSLPSPGQPYNIVSMCAARNKRKRMEDRHVVIHDLNTMFNIQEASPSSYYAIFDGHAGHDAAAYSAAHLHQFLAESKHFVANPEQALRDAFCKTDALFIEKCNVERFSSGTTAVCALLRPKEKTLYISWVGDSQALLVNQGRVLQCVNPHKPCRADERERIEKEGGYVCYWGTWRVNGQLAVSRAIGDAEYKPYVIAVPDIREIPLDGGEDFLILACDGLWDFLSEDDAATTVYNMVCQCPENTDLISEHLVWLSKERGSTDNISVIVVFLREPSKIAAEARRANRNASSQQHTMDTSLDNANNPFAINNSNGGADSDIVGSQKGAADGLLLDLSGNFRRNGAEGDFYLSGPEKANGKRRASEFDDDDDDLGPETDVDAVDDLPSPSATTPKDAVRNNNPDVSFNPFAVTDPEVEKAALETDLEVRKSQGGEFDGRRSPREETPTPPADAVHDGGLEDNIGDSGEESEDEWNYIKGEEANKENINPSQPDCEVANILEEDDNMSSQLNPNAAEFVPVSPTRSNPSPVCRALINDPVIAQSPKRPSEIDISVPNLQEFEKEVKSRPSDFDTYSNGHGDPKSSSQELMENLLNGKNIDEIPEFQPGSTPTKVPSGDEFHFGPNAAPFTPAKLMDQSETASSTKAVYGDESAVTCDSTFDSSAISRDNVDFITAKNKENDPMSMSFYQDKTGGDAESFDLNKVQMLPENLDDFLSKSEDNPLIYDDTISALSEHESGRQLVSDEILLNNDERIQTTDLDKIVDDEKELASPVSNEEDLTSGVCELSKSPNPEVADLIGNLECNLPKDACLRPESRSPQSEYVCSKSPKPVEEELLKLESTEPVVTISYESTVESVSPAPQPEPEIVSLAPQAASPEPQVSSPEPQVLSPESSDVCPISKAISPEPMEQVGSTTKSPVPEKVISSEPEQLIDVAREAEICKLDERKETSMESPLEDVTSSVKDIASPVDSPIPDQIVSNEENVQLNFAQEINQAVQGTVTVESSSPINEGNLIPDMCPISTPKSTTDTESVVTADMNSFLNRSQISDLASPLSPGDQPLYRDGVLDQDHPLMRCVYPLPTTTTEIKTETIVPEFAEPAVLSPTEQTKEEATPSVSSPLEETLKEPEVDVTVTAVEEPSAVAAAAPVQEKKPAPKPKTAAKKPPTKTTSAAAAAAKAAASPAKPRAGAAPRPRPALAAPKAPLSKPAPPKPRTSVSTPPKDKKPLTNGDVKVSKPSASTARKSGDGPKAAAAPKPSATSVSRTRPTTAPARPAAARAATAPAAPKTRPNTLVRTNVGANTKTGVTATATSKVSATKTTTTTSPKMTSPPKPRPATAPIKPRVPLTKTVTKTSADTEKQNKDSANKLTASRTVTSTRTSGTVSGRTVTSTVKRTDSKVNAGTTRTTVTKTTTTTTTKPGTAGKKPLEVTRTGNKTKPTKVEKPVQNGVSTVVTEQILVNNAVNEGDQQLMKDNSPIDNKLIVESNNAAD